MKNYIYKVLFFLMPILLLIAITETFYSVSEEEDLLRVGFIIDNSEYRNIIKDNFKAMPIKYEQIITTDLEKENHFSAMVIGDSFSLQHEFGYKNYLANQDSISVIYMNQYFFGNPIQSLINITNGDVFDRLKVDFVVLQSVERYFVNRVEKIDTLSSLSLEALKLSIEETKKSDNKPTNEKARSDYTLFSDRMIKVPYFNLAYCLFDKPYGSKTYKVNTTISLFTNKPNTLLFYQEDVDNIEVNNDLEKVIELNKTLNFLYTKLIAKGINLIVLPSPDKYDVYYDFISKKEKYPEPLFFDYLDSLPKSYLYINSKEIIKDLIKETKDAYYYDDTHWSPITAERIGLEIAKIIENHQSTIK